MTPLPRHHVSAAPVLGPPFLFLAVLFVAPIARLMWGSVFVPDFTLQHYARMWRVPVYGHVFVLTLKISVMTTFFCVLLGYPAAYLLASVRPSIRNLLLLCVIVPFFVSVLIRNYIWLILLQRTGVINRLLMEWGLTSAPLELMYNEFGVLVAMVNTLLPYMIFPILTALLAIPPELTNASASLGGGPVRSFWRVTLPLSLHGVAAGSLLVFIVALGFFI